MNYKLKNIAKNIIKIKILSNKTSSFIYMNNNYPFSYDTLLFKNIYHRSIKHKKLNNQDQQQKLINQADSLIKASNFEQAISILSSLKKIQIQKYSNDHPKLIQTYNLIGWCLFSAKKIDEAIQMFLQAVNLIKSCQFDVQSSLIVIYSNLIDCYHLKNEFEKSLEYSFKLLDIEKLKFGEKSTQVASTLKKIGIIYSSLNDPKNSIKHLNECLQIYQKIDKKGVVNTVNVLNNIAGCYEQLNQYDQSLNFYQRALNILQNNKKHTNQLANLYNNIGLCYQHKHDLDKGLSYFQKALEIQLQSFNEMHIQLASTYNLISGIYEMRGQLQKALQYLQKVLNIQIKTYGDKHLQTGITYNKIGSVLNSKGQYKNALEYFQKGLKIQFQLVGQNHPSISYIYSNMAQIYKQTNQIQKAIQFFKKALKIAINTLGVDDIITLNNYFNIGSILQSTEKIDEALTYYKKSLIIAFNILGEHLQTSIILTKIGLIYEKKGMMQQSIKHLKRSYQIRRKLGQKKEEIDQKIEDMIQRHKVKQQ